MCHVAQDEIMKAPAIFTELKLLPPPQRPLDTLYSKQQYALAAD